MIVGLAAECGAGAEGPGPCCSSSKANHYLASGVELAHAS